eukprot:gene5373-9180_t
MEKIQTIQVEIREGFYLEMAEKEFLWPSPFAKIQIGEDKKETTTRDYSIFPQWYESFNFVFDEKETITIEIYSKTNFMSSNKFLGKLEIPLNSIVLKKGKEFDFRFPLDEGYFESAIRVIIKSIDFSKDDKKTMDNWEKLKDSYDKIIQKNKEKYENELRSHSDVSEYYKLLDHCKMTGNASELFELIKTLEMKITNQQNEGIFKKLTHFISDLHTVEQGFKVGVQKRYTDLIADCIIEYSTLKLQYDKSFIVSLLESTEKKFPKSSISKLLDKIELDESSLNYTMIRGHRIHLPEKLTNIESLPMDIRKEVLASFFSWSVYEHNPRMMFNKEFSEEHHFRLKGYDHWRVCNEIHIENYGINFHCQFGVSSKFGMVIIGIRGTEFEPNERKIEMAKGWFTNLNAVLVEFPFPKKSNAKVHKGFFDNYLESKELFSCQCFEYLKSGYKIVIAGHSQGAAISSIAAAHLGFLYPEFLNHISVVTFGCPKVGDDNFALLFNSLFPKTPRYVAQSKSLTVDFVTTVPPDNMGFKHFGEEILIRGKSEWYGNPNPIKGITTSFCDQNAFDRIGLHSQQVYFDGLFDEEKLQATITLNDI